MKNIIIEPENRTGIIKPMNGVGGGPVCYDFSIDATKEFLDANIPFSRTHDIEYPLGSGEFVDIHCVFPDFDKDVNDPKSYNFALTDSYLDHILLAGAKPFYRLGSSIEHQPIKRYIYPPKDYEKWAEICNHIIAHYNNGWADGFEMGIEYWEIWNEPDLKNRCWIGENEEFFKLYEVAAKAIKKCHPEVKVGGCAVTNPHSSFTEPFLAYVRDTGAPLDFFSWHAYLYTPSYARELSEYTSELLKKYGFDHTESIYDEWNYVVRWDDSIQRSLDLHKTPFCAAFMAGVMSELQKTGLDICCYYEVQNEISRNIWNGVFSTAPMVTHGEMMGVSCEAPYYALKAWGDLRKLGTEVAVRQDRDVYVTAACDGKKLGVLVSYYNDDAQFNTAPPAPSDILLDLSGTAYRSARAWLTDSRGKNRPVAFDGRSIFMEGNSMAYLEYELE